ncbi:NUDIX domain-containing protein [Novosphingobium sp.]|uniref:NUDIX domain-containing protein n=1 Tax=Novosphingobium sp. TaxID=1874826 RepID=UPI0025D721CF|nr:NUDIX domain-containing protein [Novosphingobium sp.]MCC6926156.1 NUDIX domain-containing protein [Novosphingobium sp.]
MLHLIPAPLHRLGLRLAHAVRRRWWRLAQVRLQGCRVLAFDAEGRVLLIRHSYGSGNWMLPGGGLGRREDPLAAALRELAEETGLALDDARAFLTVDEPLYGTTNRVHLVAGQAAGALAIDGREVIEAHFFASDALPPDLSPALAAHFTAWLAAARQ